MVTRDGQSRWFCDAGAFFQLCQKRICFPLAGNFLSAGAVGFFPAALDAFPATPVGLVGHS
jgi:hypothetical protein